jgi:hypothetical protein
MCEQFKNDFDGVDYVNQVSELKNTLKVLSETSLTDDELIMILKGMVAVYSPKQSNSNSQWANR